MKDRAVVYIERGTDPFETARRCALEPLRALIKPGMRVILKVNQVGGFSWEAGSTVNPELIGVVASMISELGASQVGIAEDVGRDQDTMEMWKATGTVEVARRVGAELVDLRRNPYLTRLVPGGLLVNQLEFSAPLLEWDLLIGLTKMKTHHHAGITAAMKNMFGAIPDDYKRRFHRSDMDRAIVDINTVRHADFTIVDAFPSMEGMGPHSGTTVPMSITIAGEDPVAVDAVCAAVMGFGPNWTRYVRMAGERGIGISDLDHIEICGEPIARVMRKFKTSLEQIQEMVDGYVEIVDCTDCNGCASAVGTALMLLLRRHGKSPEEIRGLKIRIGGKWEAGTGEGTIVVGDCAACSGGPVRLLPGCPPTVTQVMNEVSAADVALTFLGPDTLPGQSRFQKG